MPPVPPPANLINDIHSAIAARGEGIACLEARQMLAANLDDELSPAERRVLGHHLEECPDCRHYAEHMRNLVELLRSGEPVRPAADLRGRIEAAVDRASGRVTVLTTAFRRKLGAAAGLAAAAAVMLAVIFDFAAPSRPPESVSPPVGEMVAGAPTAPGAEAKPTEVYPSAIASEARTDASHTAGHSARMEASPWVSHTHPAEDTTELAHHPKPTGTTPPTASAPPVAPKPVTATGPTTEAGRVVAVAPLVGARPVDFARRTDTAIGSSTLAAANLPAESAVTRTPVRPAALPDPEADRLSSSTTATLAKARPTTPTSLKSDDGGPPASTVRLASAGSDWLPVTEAHHSVYRSDTTSPARLASAAERISREVGDIKHSQPRAAIVVIK